MLIAKPFFDPGDEELRFLPEGPRVLQNHPAGGGSPLLGWVAIQHGVARNNGSINVLDLGSGQNRRHLLPGRPGFFAETEKPGIVLVGLERRLVYCDLVTGTVQETGIVVSADERVIINDGLAMEGGVLFGTKHLEFNQKIAALYYFDAKARTVRTVLGEQICSNGKFFQREEGGAAVLIDIDSLPKAITRYRLNADLSEVLERRLVRAPESMEGFPDGLRPAPDGNSVVVAFYNPARIANGRAEQICLESGKVLEEWVVPGSPRVTCPEFVRWDGQVKLVFTTAVEGMSSEDRELAPRAGSLFVAETDFTEVPPGPPLLPIR